MSRSFLVLALLCGLGMVPSARAELGDPTRPPDISTVSVAPLESGGAPFRVSSILMAPGRKVAIVNALRVEVGDEVGGATVSEINAQAVLLEMGGDPDARGERCHHEERREKSTECATSGGREGAAASASRAWVRRGRDVRSEI